MSEQRKDDRRTGRAFLGRLARDKKANTLAMMAIAVIPLAGMVGGGIDLARLYIVKTRLQHACDAGALAGRKAMGGGTWAYNNYYPRTQAEQFFNANIQASPYGASALTKSYSENAGKVTGTASATVPMTLMKVFQRADETLTVTCDAEMRLPNTDVMFVLDTTGSMGDTPSGDSVTKMASLKSAVKCFYEIVARLDSSENCTTGTPSGGTGSQVQIRFGFVPYATNVNVGKLLPTSYFANSWTYQSREPVFTTQTTTTWTQGTAYQYQTATDEVEDTGNWNTQTTWNNVTSAWCDQQAIPANSATTWDGSESSPYNQSSSGTNPITYSWRTQQDGWYYEYRRTYNDTNDRCRIQRRTVDIEQTRYWRRVDTGTETTTQVFSSYNYGQLSKDISGLKNGTNWNSSFQSQVGDDGTMKTISWDGCIEERTTVRQTSYSPIPSGAKDLDLDLVPSQGDSDSLWGPALPGMIYTPSSGYSWTYTAPGSPINTTSDFSNGSSYSCPAEARKLQTWPTASTFDTYVNSLSPSGNTYHDIGLIWGGRFLSPTGIFASENALTPQGGEIERHLIFMTDGDPCTSVGNYQAYGVGWFNRRQTPTSTAPTDGCTTTGTLTQQVNERTAALCTAIKNKNITLWVITFGTLATDTVNRMTACATPGRYFNATNAATIQSTFKSIADQISQLRLTK